MMVQRFLVGAVLLAIGGCADIRTVRDAPSADGTSHTFQAGYDRVSDATLDALHATNVHITSTREQPGGLHILVEKALTGPSWGEVGRIIVLRTAMSSTPVRIVWEKRSRLQITGTDEKEFSTFLFDRIQRNLMPRPRHDPLNMPR